MRLAGLQLHLGAPWLAVREEGGQAVVTTPAGSFAYDFLLVSTGLLTDPALRPELKLVEKHIARWKDRYDAPEPIASSVLDAHPYLTPGFAFTSRTEEGDSLLHGLFTFNYSAMISCGLSASALSGMRYAIPKLVSAVSSQLFLDDRKPILASFYAYDEQEFAGHWPAAAEVAADGG
ncbi:hypothetical protein BN871_FM_00070 [Paenibacillus sp. P22]|nr:hypothetical protein BN871_FM_00070 [Paenibacillus sp. P22]